MEQKYQEIATTFARQFSFDGVIPDWFQIDENNNEHYIAAYYYPEYELQNSSPWQPPFDNTLHEIIVNPLGKPYWADGNNDIHGFKTA